MILKRLFVAGLLGCTVLSGCNSSDTSTDDASATLKVQNPEVAAAANPAVQTEPETLTNTMPTELPQNSTDDLADLKARDLVAHLTADEKLQFIRTDRPMNAVPGGGAGYIPALLRLNIPAINMSDSSTGVGGSKQKSTSFPATLALAASWDGSLSHYYGVEVAKQLREQGFNMGLGGGANMVRDPRGGRMFEYLGEDPLLAGKMLAARTKGTQSQNVIATIKHMVGNEQESSRKSGSSIIDERTLREIYMLPFEIAVRESEPGSVMCSYNMLTLDGQPPKTYACENKHILTDILKGEWRFKGQVQSDWDATHSIAPAINAGLDEEEYVGTAPYVPFFTADKVKPLIGGEISEARLDDMVQRKLRTMIKVGLMDHPVPDNSVEGFTPATDFAAATAAAQKVAEQTTVLLKNSQAQSPLDTAAKLLPLDAAKVKKIAVIGGHADDAVMTGGGSGNTRMPAWGNYPACDKKTNVAVYSPSPSQAGCGWWRNPWTYVPTPILQAIKIAAPGAIVDYVGNKDQGNPFRSYTEDEIKDAVDKAKAADVAIVVVYQMSGESGDLKSLSLANPGMTYPPSKEVVPNNQDQLVSQVAAANSNTIVIVENGNPVLMPWKDNVAAILEAWYPGEGAGPALANILFGKVNPSAKLPITFPNTDADTPTGGKAFATDPAYSEKLNVGYRWYDANKVEPLFEFGFGLSYTDFAYSDLRVDTAGDGTKTVNFSLMNTGKVAGKEIPQVYIEFPTSAGEPPRRLAGWDKVALQPGEKKSVSITIPPQVQSIWDVESSKWKLVPPSKVLVGASSRQMKLEL